MRSYRWLTAMLAVVGLAADQATKYEVFRQLYPGADAFPRGESDLVPGWFKLTAEFDPATEPCDCGMRPLQTLSAPVMPRVNHGALFGLGGNRKGDANRFFAGVSLLAAAGILIWVTRGGASRDGWLSAALGLILGGTLGNLYDRVVFNGVRDFLYFYKIDWPVFNVADCCLVVGAGMLLLHAVLVPSEPKPAA
jgi:lipoprotein signal peptidase